MFTKTDFERQVAQVIPAGSSEDMECMAASIRSLSNVVANNAKIRQNFGIDADPGKWLKDTLEISFTDEFDFERKYPELSKFLANWYDQNIQDGITSEELVRRWRELAKALEQ